MSVFLPARFERMEGKTYRGREHLLVDGESCAFITESVSADRAFWSREDPFGSTVAATPAVAIGVVEHGGDEFVEGDESGKGRHFDYWYEGFKVRKCEVVEEVDCFERLERFVSERWWGGKGRYLRDWKQR